MIDKSFFISGEVHKRSVTLPNGEAHELFFKEIPAVEFRRFSLAEQSEDENIRVGSISKLICASLCNEDGSSAITFEQAMQLNAPAMNAIFEQVLSVNGQGATKKG
jgi:hypothetical protein